MGAAGVAVVTAGGVSAITSADQFTYAATTLTWTGSSGGNWTDAQWSGAGPSSPDVTTNAIVDSAVVVQVNSPQAANALAIKNEAQLYVAPGKPRDHGEHQRVGRRHPQSGPSRRHVDRRHAGSRRGRHRHRRQRHRGRLATQRRHRRRRHRHCGRFPTHDGIVSANLAGPGGLTKGGAGTATLSGTNTYSGGTTVSSGTLIVTNSAALPNGSSLTVGAGVAICLAWLPHQP